MNIVDRKTPSLARNVRRLSSRSSRAVSHVAADTPSGHLPSKSLLGTSILDIPTAQPRIVAQ